MTGGPTNAGWDVRRRAKFERVRAGSANADGKVIRKDAYWKIVE